MTCLAVKDTVTFTKRAVSQKHATTLMVKCVKHSSGTAQGLLVSGQLYGIEQAFNIE